MLRTAEEAGFMTLGEDRAPEPASGHRSVPIYSHA
jgi:hypothetical protein